MNTNEFIQNSNYFYFQNLPTKVRNGEYHAYFVEKNCFSFFVCVLSNTFLLNILIQSEFPKEKFLFKFLDGFTKEYEKKDLLEVGGKK